MIKDIKKDIYLEYNESINKRTKEHILYANAFPILLILNLGVINLISDVSYLFNVVYIALYLLAIILPNLYTMALENKTKSTTSEIKKGITYYLSNIKVKELKYVSDKKVKNKHHTLFEILEDEKNKGFISEEDIEPYLNYNEISKRESNKDILNLYLNMKLGEKYTEIFNVKGKDVLMGVGFVFFIIMAFICTDFLIAIYTIISTYLLLTKHNIHLDKNIKMLNNYLTYDEFKLYMENENEEQPLDVDMTIVYGFKYLMEKENMTVDELIVDMQEYLE